MASPHYDWRPRLGNPGSATVLSQNHDKICFLVDNNRLFVKNLYDFTNHPKMNSRTFRSVRVEGLVF